MIFYSINILLLESPRENCSKIHFFIYWNGLFWYLLVLTERKIKITILLVKNLQKTSNFQYYQCSIFKLKVINNSIECYQYNTFIICYLEFFFFFELELYN